MKAGQRLIHDFNNTAMGWSIPATLASSLALNENRTICIVGDGSLMMALSDLPTIGKRGLPVIFKEANFHRLPFKDGEFDAIIGVGYHGERAAHVWWRGAGGRAAAWMGVIWV